MNIFNRIEAFLFKSTDIVPLACFRILYGICIVGECVGALLTGWVHDIFINSVYTFPFIGFEWLLIFKESMIIYYIIMTVLGIFIMLGYRYRISIFLFGIMWFASYLMQKIHYNNHYFLLCLLNFLMLIVPAHRKYSLDVRSGRLSEENTIPYWCIFIFIFQLSVVYFFGAIAKMHTDWLSSAPLHVWFKHKAGYFLIGELLQENWLKILVSWGGLFFDLLIIPLLIFRKTKVMAFVFYLFFHIFNSIVFQIGVFPYMMISFLIFFIDGEKLRRIFKAEPIQVSTNPPQSNRRIMVFFCSFYILFQLVLPLRHLLYDGNLNWTEEGHRMSWHMMTRAKQSSCEFIVKHDKGEGVYYVNDFFKGVKESEIAGKPDLLWQASQLIKNKFENDGFEGVKVFVKTSVALNGRNPQPLVDESVDMAGEEWNCFIHHQWILPYRNDE